MRSGEHIAPQSEVIRAISLEDSPCCGGARTELPTEPPGDPFIWRSSATSWRSPTRVSRIERPGRCCGMGGYGKTVLLTWRSPAASSFAAAASASAAVSLPCSAATCRAAGVAGRAARDTSLARSAPVSPGPFRRATAATNTVSTGPLALRSGDGGGAPRGPPAESLPVSRGAPTKSACRPNTCQLTAA